MDMHTELMRAERDLYLGLLELGSQGEIEPFLGEALALIVSTSGATKAYMELREDPAEPDSRRWSMAHGCTEAEVDGLRETLSSGIIAEALGRGETVSTAAAVDDIRFKDRPSVGVHAIQAVLCAPVGTPVPFGVVYLQGRETAGPFSPEDRARVECFARHCAPAAGRLLAQRREADREDPTLTWRRQLSVEGVVGRSRALAEVFRMMSMAAPTRISVLMTGPSGTGKSQLARAIHDNSPRAGGPFVALNCGAIPEGLVESELFGVIPGAFTGATRRQRGKVEAAHGGTLFLDEVGELPLAVQVKLLTLLQSGTFYNVGNERPSMADLRVLAATNQDLEVAVAERRFREDLFYRLHVVRIHLPPLSERPEDVVPLARHFLSVAAERDGLPGLGLSPEAAAVLRAAAWPGNVRELANRVSWGALQAAAEGSEQVQSRHLLGQGEARDEDQGRTWHLATRSFQRSLLQETLDAAGGNRSETARRLGISRAYLYEAMANLGVS